MKIIAIIPARYASSRFPGKPLALLRGKPVIQWVYERVHSVIPDTLVATDDKRILDAVKGFGGQAVMTADSHNSGTDRCFEAYTKSGLYADIIINVQGDEPFIAPQELHEIVSVFERPDISIATLVKAFDKKSSLEDLESPRIAKVVINAKKEVMYFSRSVIPFLRDVPRAEWLTRHVFYKHVGIYAYKPEVLQEITRLPQAESEKAECLEQLRWLENGYKIGAELTECENIGIDTPEDLAKAEKYSEISLC